MGRADVARARARADVGLEVMQKLLEALTRCGGTSAPDAIVVDASQPPEAIVDEILTRSKAGPHAPADRAN